MHFVVTGGGGFIGSHLVDRLLGDNHNVSVIDNFSSGNIKNLPKSVRLRIVEKDVVDCTVQDLKGFEDLPSGIAHLAAVASVDESWTNPFPVHQTNLSATLKVIELCEKANIRRLVLASSAAVYGNTARMPVAEGDCAIPSSPYGVQKLASEMYGRCFAARIGFSFVALRLFNVFGPRQPAHSQYSGVISKFVFDLQNNMPLTMFGDGRQTRDFIFVKDVARSFDAALRHELSSGSTTICNVGTGSATSIAELSLRLRGCFPEWKEQIQYRSHRLGDIARSEAKIERLTTVFRIRPEYTLESGLKELLAA